MDIFEMLKLIIGCMYISDLRFEPYKTKAIKLLDIVKADSNQIAMAHNYIMGGI